MQQQQQQQQKHPPRGSDHALALAPSPTPITSHQAMAELDWQPEFGLVDGLRDSYEKDFGRGNFRKAADFTTDDMILAKVKGLVKA